MCSKRNSIRSRKGFTLIEILVVLAIIAVLGALLVGGVMKARQGSSLSNTRSMMSTIDKTLKEHWAHVVAEASKETGVPWDKIDTVFGPDTTGGQRNKVIWIKLRLMEAFPTSFAEIFNPYPYSSGIIPLTLRKYNGTYQQALTSIIAGKTQSVTESSACLLIALSVTRNGTALSADSLGSSYVTDTDGDGIKEFVDGWGNPLTFFRFPTNNQALQNSNPAKTTSKNVTFADPADPGGALLTWYRSAPTPPAFGSAGKAAFRDNIHAILSPFNANNACYIQPTLASWGPDEDLVKNIRVLSLNSKTMAVTSTATEPDNVYSFLLR